MKKTLVALAALAATGAYAQVTISGYFGGSFDNVTISNVHASRTGNTSETRISDHSSRVVFNAAEELGGGLTAVGQFDLRFKLDATSRIQAESITTYAGSSTSANVATTAAANSGTAGLTNPTADPVSAGNSHVGLVSKTMGSVRMGRQDIYYIDTPSFMPAGMHTGANMSPVYHSKATANTSRTPNLFWYVSPRVNGFEGTVAYSTQPLRTSGTNEVESDLGTNTANRKGDGTMLRLNYTNGPLDATIATMTMKSDYTGNGTALGAGSGGAAINAQPDQTGNNIVVKYDVGGGLKVAVGTSYGKTTTFAGVYTEARATGLGVSYDMGNINYALSIARKGNDVTVSGDTANTGTSLTALAATYNFSKRTAISALYANLKADAATTVTPFYQVNNVFGGQNTMFNGETTTILSLGLVHRF
jgi:predicted porin